MGTAIDTTLVQWFVIGGYIAIMVLVGLAFKKKSETIEGFIIAHREFGAWLTAFAYGATYFSSLVIIMGGGWAYHFGLSTLWIAVGNVVIGTLLAFIILGSKLRELSGELKALTVPELIGKMHSSSFLRTFTGFVTLIALVLYCTTITMALAKLMAGALGITYIEAVLLIGAVLTFYVATSGAYSVTWTDAIQGVVMVAGLVALAAVVLARLGGLLNLYVDLAKVDPRLVGVPGRDISMWGLVDLILVTSLAVWGLPQLISRFYTAKDVDAVRKATVVATVFAFLVTFLSFTCGASVNVFKDFMPENLVKLIWPVTPQNRAMAIPVLVGFLLDPFWAAVFVAAVMAAAMSTMDASLLTATSALAYDIIGPERASPRLLRITALVLGICVILLAAFPMATLTYIFKLAWSTLSVVFLAPLILGIFWKRCREAAVGASVCGFIAALTWKLLNLSKILVLHEFVASQIIAFAVYAVLALIYER